MSNPVENEMGRDILLIKKDKFLNKEDIEFMERICNEIKNRLYFEQDTKICVGLLQKLEYIRGLLE